MSEIETLVGFTTFGTGTVPFCRPTYPTQFPLCIGLQKRPRRCKFTVFLVCHALQSERCSLNLETLSSVNTRTCNGLHLPSLLTSKSNHRSSQVMHVSTVIFSHSLWKVLMQSIACCGISVSTLSVNGIREGGMVLRHSIQASCSLPSAMKCCRARDSPQRAHLIGGGGRGAGGRGHQGRRGGWRSC